MTEPAIALTGVIAGSFSAKSIAQARLTSMHVWILVQFTSMQIDILCIAACQRSGKKKTSHSRPE
jgi:hypothetical protein